MAEVFRFLKEHGWENESYAFIHPWIERQVLIGHATLGLEIAAERHEIETVYIPVGGGGLLAGVASALRAVRPEVRIVAVEPAGCPALERAVQAGHPVTVPCDTLCDGVAVPYITDQMYPLLVSLIDDVKLVSEKRVRETIRRLAGRDRIVAEGSGALAVAAAEDAGGAGPAVAIVTGGSIDLSKLSGILGEG
jgi:threonine dehydratase